MTINLETVRMSEADLAERVAELCNLLSDKRVRMTLAARCEYMAMVDRLNTRRARLRALLAV